MLAMPPCNGAKLIKDPSLLKPAGRSVALRNRRCDLAPRAHADLPRHARHRTDSVAPPQPRPGSCPVTFLVRQCGGRFRMSLDSRCRYHPPPACVADPARHLYPYHRPARRLQTAPKQPGRPSNNRAQPRCEAWVPRRTKKEIDMAMAAFLRGLDQPTGGLEACEMRSKDRPSRRRR